MENMEVTKEIQEMQAEHKVSHHELLHRMHDRMKEDGINISQAKLWSYFNQMADDVREALEAGQTVKIGRLCEFKTVKRAPRQARNMQTGEMMNVPAKQVVKIYPKSDLLKMTTVIE